MIDLNLLRSNPEFVLLYIKKKDPHYNTKKLIALDQQVKTLRQEVEALRFQKNQLSQEAKSGVTDSIRKRSIEIGKALQAQSKELLKLETIFKDLYLNAPNIPFDDVPVGDKQYNRIVKEVGQKPHFNFSIKNHLELAAQHKWLDFEIASRMSASQFALYRGDAVKLLYALSMFMLKMNIKHGYQPVLPPYLVNEKALEIASNFPKFKDQVYAVPQDNLFLIPTSEVALANMYHNTILDGKDLPIRMTSFTSCFRREVGGYGATERGLIRVHQFEKVEIYAITTPDQSEQEQDKMLACVEDILQQLGLHYRIILLSSEETSFQSAKTYDIELWLPGQNEYYEVSSVSNCTDFQARRGKIRYRLGSAEKPKFVHTLNGSSLSLARLLVAIMETFQQSDGTIAIPAVLKKGISFFD